MTFKRWGLAFIRLGALLLAIGVLPAIIMAVLMPSATLIPTLLLLSVAPLGAVVTAAGLVMWLVALLRR